MDHLGVTWTQKRPEPLRLLAFHDLFGLPWTTLDCLMVPRKGIEPPHLAAAGPKPAASTNFATWALPNTETCCHRESRVGAVF
jgi:hypothetical protein